MLAVFVCFPADFKGFERLTGVFGSHLHQFLALTALGNGELDLFATSAGVEPFFDDAGFFHFLGQHDFVWHVSCLGVELLDELLKDLGVFFGFGAFEDEVFPTNQFS